MEQSARFWNRFAKRYSKQPVSDEKSYQKKIEITQKYFKPEMKLLEFGCGTGSTAIIHSPYVKHIYATDISPKMIEIAQRKADEQNINNITFDSLSIDNLEEKDHCYGLVLGLNILHLLENHEEVISKVYKILKPGGIFVSSTICLKNTQRWLKPILMVGKSLCLIPLVKFLSRNELESHLRNVGFDIDYSWQPEKGKAVFLVAKKPG